MPSFQNQIHSTSVSQIFSDATWLTLADSPPNNFAIVDYDDSSWSSAFIISPYPLWHAQVVPESQDPSANLLLSGDWIWTTEMNNTAGSIAPAIRPFRKKVVSPTGQTAVSANISIAVDDTFTLFVNGKDIGSAPTTNPDWRIGYFFPDVPMDPRVNVFAISATNQFYPYSADGESSGNVLVGISMVYAISEDASVSNPTMATSSNPASKTPDAVTSSNSILKTALSVRTSLIITVTSLCLFLKSAATVAPVESSTNGSMPSFTGASSSADLGVIPHHFLPDVETLTAYEGRSQFEHLRHCIQPHTFYPSLAPIKWSPSGCHRQLCHSILTITLRIYPLHSKIRFQIPTRQQQTWRGPSSWNTFSY
jgi:hypothetical protein